MHQETAEPDEEKRLSKELGCTGDAGEGYKLAEAFRPRVGCRIVMDFRRALPVPVVGAVGWSMSPATSCVAPARRMTTSSTAFHGPAWMTLAATAASTPATRSRKDELPMLCASVDQRQTDNEITMTSLAHCAHLRLYWQLHA